MPLQHSTPISFSIHSQIGKATKPQTYALGDGWKPFTGTLQEVFDIITVQGRAFSSLLKGSHRCDTEFLSRQLFAVDIDKGMTVAELLKNDAYLDYGAGYYTTARHTEEANRFRVLFVTEEPITDAEEARLLFRSLLTDWDAADKSCKEASRIFYGVPNCPSKEITDRTMSAEVVRGLLQEQRALESTSTPGRVVARDSRLPKILKELEKIPPEGRDRAEWMHLSYSLMNSGATLEETAKALGEKTIRETKKLVSKTVPGRPRTIGTALKYIKDHKRVQIDAEVNEEMESSPAEFIEMLEKLQIDIRFNEFSRRVETSTGLPLEILPTRLQLAGKRRDEKWSIASLERWIVSEAHERKYNPLIDWLESVPWDGVDRLDRFYSTVISDTPNKVLLMRKWAISAIAAVYHPEFHNEGTLVLQGGQAAGKSSWLKSLAPGGFSQTGLTLNPEHKDDVIRATTDVWISELGELDGTFRKADVARLKAFLTEEFDRYRSPYGKVDSKVKRRVIFMASVNSKECLVDEENRRFWTIHTEEVRPMTEPQQFWAQIRTIYETGERWWLDKVEREELHLLQQEFMVLCPVKQWLSDKVFLVTGKEKGEKLNASNILVRTNFNNGAINKQNLALASKFLRDLGAPYSQDSKSYRVSIRIPPN